MFRYISILTLALLVFAVPVSSYAQNTTVLGWAPVCLNAVHCASDDDGKPKDNDNCHGGIHSSADWSHRTRVHMSQSTFPANADLVVTECLDVGTDVTGDGVTEPVCTTGDHALDKLIFCGDANATAESCDHLAILSRRAQYTIYPSDNRDYGVFFLNPENDTYELKRGYVIKVKEDGKSYNPEVEWQAWTPQNKTRRYIGWSKIVATPTPTQPAATPTAVVTPEGDGGDSIGGQQQGTLTFPTAAPTTATPTPLSTVPAENCPTVQYDPFGTVFDMKSLEPIPDARVQLREKNPQGVFDVAYANQQNLFIGGANPFVSGEDGKYIFFVENGEYSLHPAKDGYAHPALASQSELGPNAKLIYSDFYFNDSPPIVEKGNIEHRDVPLMPSDGVGKMYDLKIFSENRDPQANGTIKYSGAVSHPYAVLTVEVCSTANGNETCANPTTYNRTNGGPDKQGKFSVMLDQSKLLSGQYFKRTFTKSDLTTLQLTNKFIESIKQWLMGLIPVGNVYAADAQTSAKLEPIMQYVEGFAYDSEGKIFPNATVNFYTDLSDLPVYQAKANDQGYFRVTSDYLPRMSYRIGYVGTGSAAVSKITSSQFLAQNKEFIEAEKINPFKYVTASNNPRRTITPTFTPPTQVSPLPNLTPGAEKTSVTPNERPVPNTTQGTRNVVFLVGAILLLLIATAATLFGVHMYKKKKQQT